MSHFLTLLTRSEPQIPHYGFSLSLSVSCLLSLMCRFWLDPEKRGKGLPCCKFPFDYSLLNFRQPFCCFFCFTDDIPLSRPKKKKPRTKTTLGKLFFSVWDHRFFPGPHNKQHRSGRGKAPAVPSHYCVEERIRVTLKQ